MTVRKVPTRRHFLQAAGAVLPLPLLPSLGCDAADEVPTAPAEGHPLLVMRCASGVAQADREEPELWWPRETGRLTRDGLAVDNADRVTSELAAYAERILLVSGTRYPYPATGESHAGGGNQMLTGARPGPYTDSIMTLAQGESIDSWVARQSDVHGGEPLTLHSGRRDNYGEEVMSYRGPSQLRPAESDPWSVYQRLTGAGGAVGLRQSVNDVVLDQLHHLLAHPRLSQADTQRLELHTDSVRDFELLASRLSKETEDRMRELAGRYADDPVSLDVARLHCDLLALCMSSGVIRAATLQIGDRLDRANYRVNGKYLRSYHGISHRVIEEEDWGEYNNCQEMHADINRVHLRLFAYLLDRLIENGMLDRSVVVWGSDISTGSHRYDNLPWIIAGRGDGSLRTGEYVDAGDVTHDRLLAALLTATGHRNEDGSPIERFGDPELPGGRLDAVLA
ncbi:MAG: DUF1552 domain-containing protein [Myxococcota bacterium]